MGTHSPWAAPTRQPRNHRGRVCAGLGCAPEPPITQIYAQAQIHNLPQATSESGENVCVCGRGVCTDPNPEISLPRTGIETHVHTEPPECRAQDSRAGSELGCRHQNDPVSFSASLRHQPHPLACSLSDKSHSRDGNSTDLPKDTARAWHAGCKPGHPRPCPPGARRPRAGHRATRGTRTRGYGLAQESPAPKQNQHRSPVDARKGSGQENARRLAVPNGGRVTRCRKGQRLTP